MIATRPSDAPMRFAAPIRHLAWRLLAGLGLLTGVTLHAGPLKVFILAGQSNMEGHARIETFDHLADDPETAPLLRTMRGPDGKPASCDGVWISYLTGDGDGNFELTGRLTAGFGSLWGRDRTQPGDKIGPEFTFASIPPLYTQRIEAHGYPIVASSKVNPYALKEAAHLVDLMLAKRPDVREAMIRSGSRLCIMAWNEFTTDLPEFARLAEQRVPAHPTVPAREYWDARARGLGGSETDPFCSCGEENLLGYPGDPYAAENILIHEFAHNIHLRGLVNVDPTFDTRLKSTYAAAMKAGLWKGKYASVNHHEYFAEGVQSWFDDNRENDHDHNHVNTRKELLEYDPGLAAICREVFGDTELKYTKPATRLHGHLAGYDPSTAPRFQWPDRLRRAQQEIRAQAEARNQAANNAEGR